MCDRNLTHSLDTLKSLSINIVAQVVIRDACDTWHSLCTVTSICSIQKSKRNLQNRPPVTQQEVIQTASRLQGIQGSKPREIELINKKVWRKRKEKMFKIRNWLLLHVELYKTVVKLASYLYSAGRWPLIMMNMNLPPN